MKISYQYVFYKIIVLNSILRIKYKVKNNIKIKKFIYYNVKIIYHIYIMFIF